MPKIPWWILPTIVLAQFCCTSLWFATNGIIEQLTAHYQLPYSAVGDLTSAIQFGFISGTLVFALLSIADRFSPSKVFLTSALLAAGFNFGIQASFNTYTTLLMLRFFTGFFLAGIYPVGMKIAADYYKEGLGKSLGYLVGALVLGTALPHLLRSVFVNTSWSVIILITSTLSVFGGVMMYLLVKDGPFRSPAPKFDLQAISKIFKPKPFRNTAFGYFGHMWELYTFWVFVPVLLMAYLELHPNVLFNIPLASFAIIAVGALACVAAGYLSVRFGAQRVAFTALLLSGCCCLLAPLIMLYANPVSFLIFLLFWGFVVIADSPMLSTLVAQSATPAYKGTALTIVNCIGFAITILSIKLLLWLFFSFNPYIIMILAIGPLVGLVALKGKSH